MDSLNLYCWVELSCELIGCCLRFSYQYYDKKCGAIHESIEALDKMGMDIIESGDPDAFQQYLTKYRNTICGRHPISVFLHVLSSFIYLLHIYVEALCFDIFFNARFLPDAKQQFDEDKDQISAIRAVEPLQVDERQ